MATDIQDLDPEGFTVQCDPVNRTDNGSNVYEYEYRYGRLHVGDIGRDAEEVFSNVTAVVRYTPSGILYRYHSSEPVLIKDDGVYRMESSNRKECEEQAYYVMSILADKGFVTGFTKK